MDPLEEPQEDPRLDSKKSVLGSKVEEVEDIHEESKEPSRRFRKEESKVVPIEQSDHESLLEGETQKKDCPQEGFGEELKQNAEPRVAPVSIYCENATLIHYNHGKVEVGAIKVKNNENIHVIQKNLPNSTPTAKKKRLIDCRCVV